MKIAVDMIFNKDLLLISLSCAFEILLFIPFLMLRRKLRKLQKTGKMHAIELAARWKMLTEALLIAIPLLVFYNVLAF